MGNVPLPCPPTPSSTSAVIFLTTQFGKLHIVPAEDTDAVPGPLARSVPESEYRRKMLKLSERLRKWWAGRFNLIVGIIDVMFVLVFTVGVFFRWFWDSFIFDNPFLLVGVASAQVILVFIASGLHKRETASLKMDITELFRDWRPTVRTSIRLVRGTYPGYHETSQCFCVGKRQGTFFAVIFDVVEPGHEDVESVATADTVGSAESISEPGDAHLA